MEKVLKQKLKFIFGFLLGMIVSGISVYSTTRIDLSWKECTSVSVR